MIIRALPAVLPTSASIKIPGSRLGNGVVLYRSVRAMKSVLSMAVPVAASCPVIRRELTDKPRKVYAGIFGSNCA